MTQTTHVSLKLLSCILAVLMLVVSLPLSGYALFAEELAARADVASEPTATPVDMVAELLARRTERSKTFLLTDGSFYLAEYDRPVHTLDADGNWQDIDNTLTVSGDTIATTNARIKFAKKTTGNGELFTLHGDNHKLTLSLAGAAKKVAGEVTNLCTEHAEDATELDKRTTLDRLTASVLYRDILPQTDLEYVVTGGMVKENILVKAPRENYTYTFELSLNNLTAALTADGEIAVTEANGTRAYTIPAPFAYDAAGAITDAVTMTLAGGENSKYTLTISANSAWMNDDARVFPITIDPPVYGGVGASEPTDAEQVIGENAVWTWSPQTYKVSQTHRIFWQLERMPYLPENVYLTRATLQMNAFPQGNVYGRIGAFAVQADGTISENFLDFQYIETYRPDEYSGYYFSGSKTTYDWDITAAVREWQADFTDNHGLILAPIPNTIWSGEVGFYGVSYTDNTALRPRFALTYINTKGVEDYWSFSTQNAGFAGSTAVNHATGNFILSVPTISTTDALLPTSPTLVYQHAESESTSGLPAGWRFSFDERIETFTYSDIYHNVHTLYIYTDGDGTEHYFLPDDTANTYSDEDGLGLTLTVGTTECTLTNDAGSVITFTRKSDGVFLMTCQTDNNGNQLCYTRENGLVSAISLLPNGITTPIEQLRIRYTEAGTPYLIYNPHTREGLYLRYSTAANTTPTPTANTLLREVVHVHATADIAESVWSAFYNTNAFVSTAEIIADATASYDYTATILDKLTNNLTGYSLSVFYTAGKVSRICEAVGTTEGATIGFTYDGTSTLVRGTGSDGIYGNADDIITTYGFDTSARTVTTYSTDLSYRKLYGAAGGQYAENTSNRISTSVQTSGNFSNHLTNGGFEQKLTGWTTSGNVGINSTAHGGRYAASLMYNTGIPSSISQNVTLNKGTYYLSVAFYASRALLDSHITITSLDNSAHTVSMGLVPVSGATSNGYISAGTALNVTSDTECFTITISTVASYDTSFLVDDCMLARTDAPAATDLLANGHFDNNAGWTWGLSDELVPTATDRLDMFDNVAVVNRTIDQGATFRQTVSFADDAYLASYNYANPEPVRTFTLSGWAKGTIQSAAGQFQITATLNYRLENGRTIVRTFTLSFSKDMDDWQFVTGAFSTDPLDGVLLSITVSCTYNDHPGIGYFDNISLIEDDSGANFYVYNTDGYLTSHQTSKQTADYKYDDNGNVRLAVSSGGDLVTYTYDDHNRLTTEKTYRYTGDYNLATETASGTTTLRATTTYTYNAYGLCTSTTVAAEGVAETSSVFTTYDTAATSHLFGVTTSTTDALGNTTDYFYDNAGRLLATLYPNGSGTAYTYDAIGNLTGVTPAVVTATGYAPVTDSTSVTYTYDSVTKRLTGITTASTAFAFTYDIWGNTASVSAGAYTLASYTYDDAGRVDTLTYGNGYAVRYTYDGIGRVSETFCYTAANGWATKARYAYNAAGNLCSVYDAESDQTTYYEYDNLNRVIRSRVATSTDLSLLSTSVLYDEKSRVSVVSYHVDYSDERSDILTDLYSYNPATDDFEKLTHTSENLAYDIIPTYDAFGRTTQRVFAVSGGISLQSAYTYTTANGKTAAQVASYTSVVNGNTTAQYHYAYDQNGNITSITDQNGVVQWQYHYDELGQLVREDNRPMNKTYLYAYDEAGNRLGRRAVTFNLGDLSSTDVSQTYYYNNSTWGDLLTKADANNITYDGIGNPLDVYSYSEYDGVTTGYEMTWSGRQLTVYRLFNDFGSGKQYTTYKTYSYTYNADGIRTSKTVAGVVHTYLLNGSQVVGETWTDTDATHILMYLYDEQGAPVGLKYRNSTYINGEYDCYFFEKNLQGDIVAVYNEAGNQIGRYIYDAWGAVISAYSNTGYTATGNEWYIVDRYNPFRYRGYFYDVETKFYYLETRYYNPTWGRFVNADGVISDVGGDVRGYNVFAYCFNNPVNMSDQDGEWPSWMPAALYLVSSVVTIAAATVLIATTFGAGSVIGVAAISAAATMAVKAIEVGALQYQKSSTDVINEETQEKKSSEQIATDVMETVIFNSDTIVVSTLKSKISTANTAYNFKAKAPTFFGHLTSSTSKSNKIIAMAVLGFEISQAVFSIFYSPTPQEAAERRGYILQ